MVMKTLVSSTRKTLNRALGDMLVSSNRKLKQREQATTVESMCKIARMMGSSLIVAKLGFTYYCEMKASMAIRTNWCIL